MLFTTLQNCLAGTTISNSVTLTQSVLDSYSWPVTINGGSTGSPVILTLGENVTLTSEQNYFIINGDYVTFEGNNKTITISGISFYTGLIKNGFYELVRTFDENFNMTETINSTNGFNNLTIQNLGVLALNSYVAAGQGWIGQASFALNATNNLITNCYSNGPLRQSSGGILGEKSYGTVKKSYSMGSHIGGYAGGIFGGEGHGTAENCFSTSATFGNRGGGIFGGEASNATATNCYSTGTINENCGGIFGGFTSNCTAINCYSTGSIGSNAGGIFGGNSSSNTATNCYIANNSWVNDDANTTLMGTDGTVWNTSTNPYTLIGFGSSTIPASISNFASISKYYFDGTHTITPPNSDSSGAFTYTSSNTNVATISGTTVTIVGAGTATITATQAADSTYSSASITANLTVTSPTVVTKQGQFTSTDANYVNKYGALASNTGLSEKGEITKTKSFTTVTHGLVLNLDASNASSYSGTGTSWTDLSGSSNNMSLYNGASYDPSNQNSILFDGVNDYVGKNTAINTGQDFTVSVWMYATLLGTTRTSLVANSYDYTGGNGWFFCTDALGAPNSFFLSIGSDYPVKVSSDNSISINTWNYLTAVVKSGGRYIDLYKNGILISGATTDSGVSTINYNYDNFSIGLRDPAGTPDPFEGNIGTTHIYNLALTAEEVLQNFNATKERYGL